MSSYKDWNAYNEDIAQFINTPCVGNCDKWNCCLEIAHIDLLRTEQMFSMFEDLKVLMMQYWDDENPFFCLNNIIDSFTFQLIASSDFEHSVSNNEELKYRRWRILKTLYSSLLDNYITIPNRLQQMNHIEWAIEKNIYPDDFEWMLKKEIYYPNTSLVYFIGSDNPLTIKIGFTTNLEKRIKSLQTGFPRKLIIYGVAFGDKQTEKKLHNHFAKRKSHGEWFYLSEDLKEFILNLSYPAHDFPYLYHYKLLNNINKAKQKLKKHRIP